MIDVFLRLEIFTYLSAILGSLLFGKHVYNFSLCCLGFKKNSKIFLLGLLFS
jgi:hypothetical protein